MNINDSTYSNQALRAVQGTQGVGKANEQVNVKPVVAPVDENNQSSKSKNLEKDKSRFDVSEEAIALLEQQAELNSAQSGTGLVARGENSSTNNSASDQQQAKSSQYDKPSQQNLSAVAAYQSVDNIAQRENIKQFFGVNLFA
ncbi:hypothetical protein [Pseudocolwellia agarivorans]|uniref:hypothetical protein n=1 Tax=Pseudocolwellia agarivorans TaxID=1911682 RepID=UPI00098729EF|nr:hypothetical protein [Pseudocolwellia agarivorans]